MVGTCVHAGIPWQPLFLAAKASALTSSCPALYSFLGVRGLDNSGTSAVNSDPSLPGSQPHIDLSDLPVPVLSGARGGRHTELEAPGCVPEALHSVPHGRLILPASVTGRAREPREL